MVIKQYPIYYDLMTGIVLPYKVSITQGDTDSIQFVVTVTNNGAPVDLSNISSTFTFQKEDGNVVVGRAEVNEKNIVYTVGTQEIACPGKVIATFELYGQNGERLSSSQFKFTVIEELGNDSPIESTTEYTILAQLIKDNIAIQTAEETRIKNENERITAEQERRTEYEALKDEINSYITDIQDAIESSQTVLDLANQASQIANNIIEDATETINRMDELIEDATDSINTINTLTQTVQQNESERVTAEQKRIDNEEERIQNESDRVSAEQTREANESERITQENIRITNENSRITAENNRIAKEIERQENEAERATKEIERINAENIRISNENDRISSEQDRVSAENIRIQNETERINAEAIREANETARINAEIIREENEAKREQLKAALELLKDSLESGNFGDMYKSIYDKNNNGIVDNAEKVNGHTVESDVPKNAVFTDTIYDDTELSNRVSDLEANKVDKVEGKGLSTEDYTTEEKQKLAGIEEGANNYIHPSEHPASIIKMDNGNTVEYEIESHKNENVKQFEEIYNRLSKLKGNDIQARREILDIKLKLDEMEVVNYLNKTGIGFYDLFTDTENIDTVNTTATVDTTETDVTFTGTQLLKMLPQKFDENINNIELAIYDIDRESYQVDNSVSNSTQIQITIRPDKISIGDKYYYNGEVYEVTGVSEA